jgi:branched-chain amino acid transport system substrate-binding protein
MKQVFVLLATILILMTGCGRNQPLRLGFVGGFTGGASDMSVDARNGAQLAVREINADGGVRKRSLKLVVEDDRHNPFAAVEADIKLVENECVAIIGHLTSAMSLAAVPYINKQEIVMLSPTVSTNSLSGLDDFFFRITSANKTEVKHLAEYLLADTDIRSMGVLYDMQNISYTMDWLNRFEQYFAASPQTRVYSKALIRSSEITPASKLEDLLRQDPDGLLFITSAIDNALLCQHLHKLDQEMPVFACGWAMTEELIKTGGPAVEGLIISHQFNPQSSREAYVAFSKAYKEFYETEPTFAAAYGYEAVRVLATALEADPDPEQLKKTLLEIRRFPGLQNSIIFDEYGDVHRNRVLLQIRDGEYTLLQ